MSRDTQAARIIRYLEDHPEGITPYEAFVFLRITKLATRISELIRDGYTGIEKVPEIQKYPNGETIRYMRYRKAA